MEEMSVGELIQMYNLHNSQLNKKKSSSFTLTRTKSPPSLLDQQTNEQNEESEEHIQALFSLLRHSLLTSDEEKKLRVIGSEKIERSLQIGEGTFARVWKGTCM